MKHLLLTIFLTFSINSYANVNTYICYYDKKKGEYLHYDMNYLQTNIHYTIPYLKATITLKSGFWSYGNNILIADIQDKVLGQASDTKTGCELKQ